MYINCIITGVPYGKSKTRGNKEAASTWTEEVVRQTKHLPRIKEACFLKVSFLLPEDKYPKDFPYGPDLDNLLKRTLDALNQTVFSETAGKDSCIVAMTVMKTPVGPREETGMHLEILPISV